MSIDDRFRVLSKEGEQLSIILGIFYNSVAKTSLISKPRYLFIIIFVYKDFSKIDLSNSQKKVL